jgi:chitinase
MLANMLTRRASASSTRGAGLLAGPLAVAALLVAAAPAGASQPVEMAAPYEYLGWGQPQPPAEVLRATGVPDVTLAFILSRGACNPEWDGLRPLAGGSDAAAIESVRAAGGDVVVSFGGWSGRKLGNACANAASLARAYQKVIDAYALRAIDIDIEHTEFGSAAVRKRVVAALSIVQAQNPGIEISITMGTSETGPDAAGKSLIADAAAISLLPTAWTVMPFDFGVPRTDMGHASIRAVEGLVRDLVSAYGISTESAYAHAGISSMNGHTDEASEVVSVEDMRTMLAFAQQHHLARFTFWAVNRDRACSEGLNQGEDCSGIGQAPFAFTDVIAEYHG